MEILNNKYGGSIIGATLWGLWLERNNRIFNNKIASFLSISYDIKHMVIFWTGQKHTHQDHIPSTTNICRDSRRQLKLREIAEEGEKNA